MVFAGDPPAVTSAGKIAVLCGMILLAGPTAGGRPDPGTRRQAGTLTVYRDTDRPLTYYYAPPDLVLGKGPTDAPDVLLLLTRYTGTAVRADQQEFTLHSLLSFHVVLPTPSAEHMTAARKALSTDWRRIELRPLPIRRLGAAVLYTPIDSGGASPTILPAGDFEPGSEEGSRTTQTFWHDRYFTIRLGTNDAQLLWSAMESGQLLMSLGYAFYADGERPAGAGEELTGSPELVAEIRRRLEQRQEKAGAEGSVPIYLAKAGSLPIRVDAQRWPGLCKKVDINECIPPGYPVLRIYCFDFRNALHPDLYEKEVEIEATSVTGAPVRWAQWFNESEPDLYCRTMRSRFAVRLDKPYRYRTRAVFQDGRECLSNWQERTVWTTVLDVTTPQAEEPANPESENDDEGEGHAD